MNSRHHVFRTIMTITRVKTLIEEQGGEYYELYAQLSEDDQERLARAVHNLVSVCNNMGVKSALELLLRLGEYMVRNDNIRTKNRQN